MRSVLRLAALAGVLVAAVPLAPRPRPAEAGTALRLEIPDLVREADLVFEGRVEDIRPRTNARGRVETEVTLRVERTFLGEPAPYRVVRLKGGRLPDGSGVLIPGMPRLSLQEDVLLFLSAPSADGSRMPVGLSQGKWRVVTDVTGARSLVRTSGPLEVAHVLGAPVASAPEERLDYADGIAQVIAACEARRAEGR